MQAGPGVPSGSSCQLSRQVLLRLEVLHQPRQLPEELAEAEAGHEAGAEHGATGAGQAAMPRFWALIPRC